MTFELRRIIDDDGYATEHIGFYPSEFEAEIERQNLTYKEGFDSFRVREV